LKPKDIDLMPISRQRGENSFVQLNRRAEERAIPDFQTLMLPLLRLAAQGEVKMSDAYESLADEFQLGAEERAEMLPSGKQTVIHNRIGWAKTFLAKAGLLERLQRGTYRITERGKNVLSGNPSRIDNRYPLTAT